MKTLLVPLDGSPLAEHVLPYIPLLATTLDARIHLIQVLFYLETESLFAYDAAVLYGSVDPFKGEHKEERQAWETLHQNAEAYLETKAMELRSQGFDVDFSTHVGVPADIIVEVAESKQAAMIAMATHGYSGLRRWTLGSVTDKVVHTTTLPLFIVRGEEVTPPQTPTFKRLLVPLDGSELARQALPLALTIAKSAQAEIVLMEAISPTIAAYPGLHPLGRPIPMYEPVMEELRTQATQDMQNLATELAAEHVAVKTEVLTGHAAEVIVDEAEQREVDLIVMATHGYSGLRRWALGSVADKVLHATTTPLLLVHAQAAPN